jgi:hypothetical protein
MTRECRWCFDELKTRVERHVGACDSCIRGACITVEKFIDYCLKNDKEDGQNGRG